MGTPRKHVRRPRLFAVPQPAHIIAFLPDAPSYHVSRERGTGHSLAPWSTAGPTSAGILPSTLPRRQDHRDFVVPCSGATASDYFRTGTSWEIAGGRRHREERFCTHENGLYS